MRCGRSICGAGSASCVPSLMLVATLAEFILSTKQNNTMSRRIFCKKPSNVTCTYNAASVCCGDRGGDFPGECGIVCRCLGTSTIETSPLNTDYKPVFVPVLAHVTITFIPETTSKNGQGQERPELRRARVPLQSGHVPQHDGR